MKRLCYTNTIFTACDHPFAFAVERHTSNVVGMALERENGGWICRFDVEEFYGVVSRGSKESLVRRYAEAIHLGVRMRDRATADTTQGLPESVSS
jgi:hypothetical protein